MKNRARLGRGEFDGVSPLWSIYMDDPVVRQLLPGFAVVLQKRLALLKASIAAGDFAEVVRLAHVIRGAAGSYGYGGIADVAGRIELQAGSIRDPFGIGRDAEELQRLAAGVLAGVASLPRGSIS